MRHVAEPVVLPIRRFAGALRAALLRGRRAAPAAGGAAAVRARDDAALDAARAARAWAGDRAVVALQLRAFDKGGLEEVVLSLLRGLPAAGAWAPVVLDASGRQGHLAEVAAREGLHVVPLFDDRALLQRVLDVLRPAVANLHYDVFGADVLAARGVPVVYTIHNTYVWATTPFVAERAPLYERAAALVAVSDAVADFFARRFAVPRERVQVIPNGLPPESLQHVEPFDRARLGIGPDTCVFLDVASFNWNKFHVLLLAAMQRLVAEGRDAHLVLLGNVHDADCHAFVQEQRRQRGLERHVTLLDYLPKPAVLGLMQAADCFVLPSLLEGCSIAALEAHWSGLPLILSDVGAARMLVRNGDVGHVVPNACPDLQRLTPQDVVARYNGRLDLPNLEALTAAMLDVADHRAEWRRRAAIGRTRVEAEFSAAAMCRAYTALFDRTVRMVRAQ